MILHALSLEVTALKATPYRLHSHKIRANWAPEMATDIELCQKHPMGVFKGLEISLCSDKSPTFWDLFVISVLP